MNCIMNIPGQCHYRPATIQRSDLKSVIASQSKEFGPPKKRLISQTTCKLSLLYLNFGVVQILSVNLGWKLIVLVK